MHLGKVTFTVTANNDAHIFLSEGGTPTSNNGYEIVLGGWGNSKSVIRTGTQSTERATIGGMSLIRTVYAFDPNPILHGGAMVGGGPKTFTIAKTGSSLTVQNGAGTTVLEYGSATQATSEVWVMSGWGSTAQWSDMKKPQNTGSTHELPNLSLALMLRLLSCQGYQMGHLRSNTDTGMDEPSGWGVLAERCNRMHCLQCAISIYIKHSI